MTACGPLLAAEEWATAGSMILVAEQSNRIVGCLSLHGIPYLERTGRWAKIESLVVDQSSRGR